MNVSILIGDDGLMSPTCFASNFALMPAREPT
jgi:hypothetical protein